MLTTQFVAFHAFWPFHRILNVYKSENFQNAHLSTILWNICQAIAYSAVVFGYIVSIVAQGWLCYEVDFELRKMAPTLGMMMLAPQLGISHASLTTSLQRVNAVIASLQRVVKTRCDQSAISLSIYAELEKRFEFFVSLAIKYSIAVTVEFFFLSGVTPIFYLIFKFPAPDHWPRAAAFAIPLPAGTNVFIVHYTTWSYQICCCIMLYIMLFAPALFFAGMWLYIIGMRKDIQTILTEVDANRTAAKRFVDAVLFHNKLLEYVTLIVKSASIYQITMICYMLLFLLFPIHLISFARSVGEILSVGLFFQLLLCAVSLAVCMAGLEKNSVLSMSFLLAWAAMAITMASAYIYCYLSEQVTSTLSEVNGVFYDVAWYELTVKEQKLFGVVIQRTQKEFRMTGLGLVECSLRMFATIIRTAASYFLIMRKQ